MMAKALLIIDYTYDSVADDGALTCGKPAQKLENSLVDIYSSYAIALTPISEIIYFIDKFMIAWFYNHF